jgi:tetratricopeptide (TPR) repeat protein
MKRKISTVIMLLCSLSLYAVSPSWLEGFRDAVFGQNVTIDDAERLFQEADRQTRENLNGSALYAMLSRCEYLLGRVYQDHNRKNEAASHFEKGIKLAEEALAQSGGAAASVKSEAHEMIASNIGHLCMLKSTAWVMANGLKVEENAKKALQFDSRNARAQYMISSRWAFGPGIFGDPKRGIAELEKMLNGQMDMEKDSYFNAYAALGYAHMRLNRNQEALSWVQKSLALYPTSKFALDLQSEIQQKIRTAK